MWGLPRLRALLRDAITAGDADYAAYLARVIAHTTRLRRKAEKATAKRLYSSPYDTRFNVAAVRGRVSEVSEPIQPGVSELVMPEIREAVVRATAKALDYKLDVFRNDQSTPCRFCGSPNAPIWNSIANVACCGVCNIKLTARMRSERKLWLARERYRQRLVVERLRKEWSK
jgi:hypothetical protein